MDPSDSLAHPAPGEIGVRVEILPDVFVEMETARRIHALVLLLVTLIALWARGQTALRRVLVRRPVLSAGVAAPAVASAPAPDRPASELHFLEGFGRARKRAFEVLQYAITTAPPALRARTVELAGDPAAPLDPGRFRLKIACIPTEPTVATAFVENLRVLLPQVAVVESDTGPLVHIDSAGVPEITEVTPAGAPATAAIEIVPARPSPAPGLVRTASGGALTTAVVIDDSNDPPPAQEFPRATAVPAPDRGRLVPLFAAPGAKASPAPDAEEPEDGELE